MVATRTILTNVMMTTVVMLYIFGGKQPLVSQVTAVAAATTQIITLLSELVVSHAVQRRKFKCDEHTKDVTAAFANSQLGSAIQFVRDHVRASDVCVIGSCLVLYTLARHLRFPISSFHSVLVALPLGMLAAALSQRSTATSDTDGDDEEDNFDDEPTFDDKLKESFEEDQTFLLDELAAGLESLAPATPTSEELLASTYLKLLEA
eukprot:TRINITY_DN33004_c0_g1_i1.p1 TRINITY_DN33004_c0_g1~~TRINITY_DN33004_c0_g1_i1.p1  ORF type:complete len:206 (+),score=50.86 TRINITY_DN33004_c0_g1_i1:108-725(+)